MLGVVDPVACADTGCVSSKGIPGEADAGSDVLEAGVLKVGAAEMRAGIGEISEVG